MVKEGKLNIDNSREIKMDIKSYAIPLNFEQLKSDSKYRFSLIMLKNKLNTSGEMLLTSDQRIAEELLASLKRELRELEKPRQ